MSWNGKEVVPSTGVGCAACQHLQRACGPGCVFAPHFPAGDDPARFAGVHAAFGADNVAAFLGFLPPEWQAEVVGRLVLNAPRRLAAAQQPSETPPCTACQLLQRTCVLGCVFAPHFQTGDRDPAARFAAGNIDLILCGLSPDQRAEAVRSLVGDAPPPLDVGLLEEASSCVACRHLHRKCGPDCMFAPHFPHDDDPKRFAAVNRVYGVGKFARWLGGLPPERKVEAAASSVYEARCRLRDPVLGVTGDVAILSMALKLAEEQLAATREELTAAREELARYTSEELVNRSNDDVPGSSTGVTAVVLVPAETVATILMQQRQPSEVPTAAAGVQDPGPP